jgi:colanic acid biosynthesis glycosyl transferase WcaI
MKLLVISQYFFPEDFRINELVQEFTNRGHEVTILTGRPNYPEGKIFPEYIQEREKYSSYLGARVIRCPIPARGKNKISLLINYLSFIVFGTIYGLSLSFKHKFDNIFVFEPSPITVCLPAIAIKKINKTPVTLWVLDLWPDTLEAVGILSRASYLWKFLRKLAGWIYRNCDLILGQSRSFVAEIQSNCSAHSNIRYFPNWTEDIYVNPTKIPEYFISSEEHSIKIVFAGNIGEAQDFPTIVEALKNLDKNIKAKLYVLGDGRKKDWLLRAIQENALQNRIELLGRFPSSAMPSFFMSADLLLVSLRSNPVFDKTVPGKLQSYLISKKPVIGMLSGEGAAIIKESGAGFICSPGDSDGLKDAIAKFALLPQDERQLMGNRGYAFATTHFTKKHILNNLELWLNDLRDPR